MADAPIDSPEYAKALGVLKEVLPESVDPMKIWSALQGAGLTISEIAIPEDAGADIPPLGDQADAAPSGAPSEGEPQGMGGGAEGMNIGDGPPTDDLVRKAFQATMAERG